MIGGKAGGRRELGNKEAARRGGGLFFSFNHAGLSVVLYCVAT